MKMNRFMQIVLLIAVFSLITTGCQPEQELSQKQPEPQSEVKLPQPPVETKEIQKESTIVDKKGIPKLVVTKAVHDFGEIGPASANNLADYSFVNKGDAKLKVTRIQSTCGCSQPTLIKDGKRYDAKRTFDPPIFFEPGEQGKVEVKYKASTRKGPTSKKLYILSDDPAKARSALEVKAQVVVNVDVIPEKLELRLDEENAGMPELVIKSKDDKPFSITSAKTSRDVITIPFNPEEKAKKFVLKPTVNKDKLNDYSTGLIQISTTHPQANKLSVRYKAAPLFEVSNPRFILKNVEPGKVVLRDNLIKSNYGEPAEIESIKSKNGFMEIVDQVPDGDHVKLSIKITPPSQQPESKRYITDELTINLKGGHKLSIRCSGWFRTNT